MAGEGVRQSTNLADLLRRESLNLYEIEVFLHQQFFRVLDKKPNEKKIWEKTAEGKSIFEMACALNQVALFQSLLDFDFPIPAEYPKEGLHPDIIALLETRGAWQRNIQEEQKFPFNRAAVLMAAVPAEVSVTRGEAVLLFGKSGHGKSTLCNHQLGVDYIKDADKKISVSPECAIPEQATRGQTKISQTLFPSAYVRPGKSWCMVDMAGICDSRGPEYDICAANGVEEVTQKIEMIKALLLVCPAREFEDNRLHVYKEIAIKVGLMLLKDKSLAQQLLLTITSPKKRVTREKIILELEALWDSEDLGDVDERSPPDKQALQCVTEILLNSPTRILMADVTKPEVRDELAVAIDGLPAARNHREFDFSSYQEWVGRYRSEVASFRKAEQVQEAILLEQKQVYETQQAKVVFFQRRDALLANVGTIDQEIHQCEQRQTEIVARHAQLKQEEQVLLAQALRVNAKIVQLERQKNIMDAAPNNAAAVVANQSLLGLWRQLLEENQRHLEGCRAGLAERIEAQKACEQELTRLRQRKIDIEAAQRVAGDDIRGLIREAAGLASVAKAKYESAEKILAVNATFFARVRALDEKLNPAARGAARDVSGGVAEAKTEGPMPFWQRVNVGEAPSLRPVAASALA